MRYSVFDDATGVKVGVNPSQVTTVIKVDDRRTDINMVGGAVIQVELSFENTLSRLNEHAEVKADAPRS